MQPKDLESSLLSSRFNAHMTFNVLNVLKGVLVSGDVEEANQLLDSYSRLLRKMVVSGSIHTSIRSELETITDFLEIERLRMDNTFTYKIDVPGEVLEQNIPKSVLISLVENAVKHGMRYSQINGFMGRGFIKIDCPENELSMIRICNNAPFKNPNPTKGDGLNLTRDLVSRFNQLTGSELTISYSEEIYSPDEVRVEAILSLS